MSKVSAKITIYRDRRAIEIIEAGQEPRYLELNVDNLAPYPVLMREYLAEDERAKLEAKIGTTFSTAPDGASPQQKN